MAEGSFRLYFKGLDVGVGLRLYLAGNFNDHRRCTVRTVDEFPVLYGSDQPIP